jgi:hypothetical protein
MVNQTTHRDRAVEANHEHHVASVTPVTGRAPVMCENVTTWIAEADHAADQDRTEGSGPSPPRS